MFEHEKVDVGEDDIEEMSEMQLREREILNTSSTGLTHKQAIDPNVPPQLLRNIEEEQVQDHHVQDQSEVFADNEG